MYSPKFRRQIRYLQTEITSGYMLLPVISISKYRKLREFSGMYMSPR
jgi:hypothetical protein